VYPLFCTSFIYRLLITPTIFCLTYHEEYEECVNANTELQLVANPGDSNSDLADAPADLYPLGNCLGDCDR